MQDHKPMAEKALQLLDNKGEATMYNYILHNSRSTTKETRRPSALTLMNDGTAIKHTSGSYSFAWTGPNGLQTETRRAMMPPGNNYIPHTKPQPLYDWPNSESLHRTIIEIVEENLYLDPSKSGYRRIDEDEAHIIAPSLREILLQAVSTFEISARLAEVLEAETFNVAYAVWNQLPAEQKIRLADETKARLQQDYCRHSRQPPHRQGDYFRQRLSNEADQNQPRHPHITCPNNQRGCPSSECPQPH